MRALLLSFLLLSTTPAMAAGGTRGDAPTDSVRKGKQPRTGKKANKRKKGKKKAVRIDAVSPLHGVLLYGPKLGTHDKYADAANRKRPTKVKPKHLPDRQVNRDGDFAVGLTAGMLNQGYADGSSNGDLGLGLKGRYRPVEYIGLELGIQRHADGFLSGDRTQTLSSASVNVFAFPWAKLSPYAIAGLTLNGRQIDPSLPGSSENLTGAHIGAGLEIALQKNLAIDLEGRAMRWLDRDATDATNPGAIQVGAGVMFHF